MKFLCLFEMKILFFIKYNYFKLKLFPPKFLYQKKILDFFTKFTIQALTGFFQHILHV